MIGELAIYWLNFWRLALIYVFGKAWFFVALGGFIPFLRAALQYEAQGSVHIAEPYRRDLLPGFDEARVALKEIGALAVGISGSGPTVFALVDDYVVANRTAAWFDEHYRKNDSGFVHICRADLGGARCID